MMDNKGLGRLGSDEPTACSPSVEPVCAVSPAAPLRPTGAGFTPGPYKVDGTQLETTIGGFTLVWGGGELLAYVARPADAALFSSAPDLYEALEAAENAAELRANCELCDPGEDWSHCPSCSIHHGRAIDMRRSALAKARGEQS